MRWLLSFLLLVATLSAEENEEFSLVNLTKSPIPRTAGTVNIISGNFVDQAIHTTTSGPDPYTLAHSYISSSLEEGTISDGWDYFHPSDLIIHQPQGISYATKGSADDLYFNYATLLYREAGGASIIFKGSQHARHFKPKLHKTGYTVISSIDAPTRRDVRQTTITHDKHHDTWLVTLHDGTKRTYTPTKRLRRQPYFFEESHYKRSYHIAEERLPSGNYRLYSYHTDHTLKSIETLSSDKKHTLHTVSFKKDHHHIDVETSDGLSTAFSLKKIHDLENAHIVAQIKRPCKPDLSYSYSEQSHHHLRRIDKRFIGSGRTDEVKFYKEGKNEVGDKTVEVTHHNAKDHVNRVRELWTHTLPHTKPALSHAFFYSDGKATVVEDDGDSTIYEWDHEKRLTSVARKSHRTGLINTESYTWDDGRLTSRTITDDEKKPLLVRSFHYDQKNDVTRESLRGRFTHSSVSTLSDNHDHIHGGETFTWKATYNDRHLKTGECDPLGNWTWYEYEPHRDLLTARFTCAGEHIIRREFFEYDSAAVCTEEIVDNGSSKHKDHMTNVTRRSIHTLVPRKKIPSYGAPEEERWYTWTPTTKKLLVKKEVFHRNSKGLVTKKELFDTEDKLQKAWHYSYDASHRLIESIDPTGRTERFIYDDIGRLSSKQTPEAAIYYTYDLFDRPITEKTDYPDGSTSALCRSYSRSGRLITQIDSRGRTTTTRRDLLGRIEKKILPTIASNAGTIAPVERVSYTSTKETRTSPTGAVTKILRSATGKPLVTTNPFGAKTFYRYDGRNRILEQVDPSGLTTTYEYDALNRIVTTTKKCPESTTTTSRRYEGDELVEESDGFKRVAYTYDAYGRKTCEVTTDRLTNEIITIRTSYDTLHRPIRVVNEALQTEELTTYDKADRVLEKKIVGADGTIVSLTTKAYDLAGRTIEEGVGRAGTICVTRTTYGAFGLPSSTIMPDGTKTVFSYQPLYTHTDGLSYLKKTTTDAKGVTTEELLDANDQPRLILTKDPFGTLIAKRQVLVSVLGKPVLIEDEAIANGSATTTVKTRFEYDMVGQLLSCTQAADTPEQAVWAYEYDTLGRKVHEKKPSGTVLTSSYDGKSRLMSYKSSDGSIALSYKYNDQDLPVELTNEVSHRSTIRTYDGLGHVLSETLENGLCLKADVKATDLLYSLSYPDGSVASYSYLSGRLRTIQRNGYSYEVASRDSSGLITQTKLPDSSHLSYTVDVMGRLTSVRHPAFTEERTAFDSVGCLVERSINGTKELFSYDWLRQLTCDNGRSASYDSLHRRIESAGAKATHNSRHQLLTQGALTIQYDVDGRRLSDGKFRYTYDALDRLIRIENDQERVDYQYDGFNRRILATGSALTEEKYLWHGDNEIGSVDAQGKITSLRLLGEGLGGEIGAAVAIELKGTLYTPIHDLSGHLRVLLTQNGEVAETISYTAFGIERRTPSLSPWTFSSKREDRFSGFFYFGRRIYDPQTATWLTQDPLGYTAGPNLYAYVKNNPLTLIDAMGLVDSEPGFFGGLWDGLCGLFGGDENSGSTGRSYSGPPPEYRVDETREVFGSNGNPVTLKRSCCEYDQLFIYPQGSIEAFVNCAKGVSGDFRVAGLIGGMLTDLRTDLHRAQAILEAERQYISVFILHNATHGFVVDFMEAAANVAGRSQKVGTVLLEQLVKCLDACLANNLSFPIDFIAHSQGAAILNNILETPEFARYSQFRGDVSTYGGACIIQTGTNYVASIDLVPWMCPPNLPYLIPGIIEYAFTGHNSGCVQFLPSYTLSPLEAHSFEGKSYQLAFESNIHRGSKS